MTVTDTTTQASHDGPLRLRDDQVNVQKHGDAVVVRPLGSVETLDYGLLDEAATVLLAPVRDQMAGRGVPLVVFDLGELESAGSVLMSLLLRCHKLVSEDGGEFVLCQAGPAVRELIQITALDTVWAIYETRDSALESIGA